MSLNFGLNPVKLKFWSKKKSIKITEYDPVYKVIYLGNVLTPWAKGESSIDKPLATLWKNYCSNVKHDMFMKLTICNSGLKAVTHEHGLTEYWANRITFASTHPNYPKIFCWIYRHEGRKMKQELRCHAILCNKESKVKDMAKFLNQRLTAALEEFRREKKYRQNVRLSLASSCHELPSIPMRKKMLIKGFANFRQPIERSKSAPKLTSIEELLEENLSESDIDDVEDDVDEDNFSNLYGSVFSEEQESYTDTGQDDSDSLVENFQSLTKNDANFCLNQEFDNFIEEMPNPFLKVHKLGLISENKQEYEDTISNESGYSETGDTVSGKSTNEAS